MTDEMDRPIVPMTLRVETRRVGHCELFDNI